MKNEDVIRAWIRGDKGSNKNLATNGRELWSYATTIGVTLHDQSKGVLGYGRLPKSIKHGDLARRLINDSRVPMSQTLQEHADMHFAIATIVGKPNPRAEIPNLHAWARDIKQRLAQTEEDRATLTQTRRALVAATRAFEEDLLTLANADPVVQPLIDAALNHSRRKVRGGPYTT